MTFIFYALCIGIYFFAKMTTIKQRHRWLMNFFTIVALIGAAGFLWEFFSRVN